MTLAAGAVAAALAACLLCLAATRADAVLVGIAHPEARRLRLVGWPWSAAIWEGARIGAACGAAAAVALAGGDPPAALTVALVAALLPSLGLRLRAESARERARRHALDELRAVAAALASGSGLGEALGRATAAADDHAPTALARAVREFRVGAPLPQALRAASGDADPGPREALLGLAVGVEERLPVAQLRLLVGSLLERLAHDEQLAQEVRARTSGARLQIWVMALLVPGLGAYLALTVPLVAEVLASDLGRRLLIPGAVGLEVAGILLARRVVRDVAA